jgi:predicted Zn-dependent protease
MNIRSSLRNDSQPGAARHRLRAGLLACLAMCSTLAVGCATSGVNSGDFNLISLDQEWQLGDQLSQDVAKQMKLVKNSSAAKYLDRVGQSIVAQTELRNRPWHFHLVDDSEINAFNIPGGHVYVNTGLVEAAPDAAAFAGVLAHEIGHGVARHGTEQLTKIYGINILGGLLLGKNPKAYEQILAQIAATGAVAKFSRADEAEADQLGVRYSYDAGYDAMGLPRMLQVLAKKSQGNPGKVGRFFATHPMTQDRIQATEKLASTMGNGGRRNESGFSDFQRVAEKAD